MAVGLEKPHCYSRKCWPRAKERPLKTISLSYHLHSSCKQDDYGRSCVTYCSMHWCIIGLPCNGSCSTEGDSGTELHSQVSFSSCCLLLSLLPPPPLNTFGTYPLVFTKLLSLVRRVPQREPIQNYIFFQNFQLVKCHQHLHQLEKSNRALYRLFWGYSSCPRAKFAHNLRFPTPSSTEGTRSASFCFYC